MKPIYLIPLGAPSRPGVEPGLDLLEYLAAALARAFRTPCQIRPETFDLSFALDPGRQQYYSTAIIQHLERAVNPDARVLGVTASDLYVPVLTFVFGEAQLDGNCHELGHTFGLRHCADWRCVMTSSHAVERLDVKGAEFCRACRKPIFSNGYW